MLELKAMRFTSNFKAPHSTKLNIFAECPRQQQETNVAFKTKSDKTSGGLPAVVAAQLDHAYPPSSA